MSAFDPNSNDAMFARIMTKLDQHSEIMERIETRNTAAFELLTGRVTHLENWRSNLKGKLAVIATGFSLLGTAAVEAFRGYFHKGPS